MTITHDLGWVRAKFLHILDVTEGSIQFAAVPDAHLILADDTSMLVSAGEKPDQWAIFTRPAAVLGRDGVVEIQQALGNPDAEPEPSWLDAFGDFHICGNVERARATLMRLAESGCALENTSRVRYRYAVARRMGYRPTRCGSIWPYGHPTRGPR